jgi:phenylpyruvate tautomerase PptA (4-oxalocrotonate tautomerase family)
MKGLLSSLAGESVLILGVASALCAALGAPEVWTKVVLAAIPLVLALAVRQVTSSPATVAAAVTDAATKTAEKLTTTTVGAVGSVTAAGEGVVTGVVGEVLGAVGGLAGALAKGGN